MPFKFYDNAPIELITQIQTYINKNGLENFQLNFSSIRLASINQLDRNLAMYFYKYVQSWDIQALQLGRHSLNNNILKTISHIHFTNLEELHLQNCKIYTIQPISWLNISSLNVLDLTGNFFKSLKSFVKTSFHNLSMLSLQQNTFTDSETKYLQRVNFHSENFKNLSFKEEYQMMEDHKKKYHLVRDNLIFLAKFQPKKVQHIEILNQFTVDKERIKYVLEQKFSAGVQGAIHLIEELLQDQMPQEYRKQIKILS